MQSSSLSHIHEVMKYSIVHSVSPVPRLHPETFFFFTVKKKSAKQQKLGRRHGNEAIAQSHSRDDDACLSLVIN